MQNAQSNLFTRPDTFFGVCEGLGEDLRIHPNLLRTALAGLLFLNPPAAVAAYVGAGALVLVTRWLVPNPMPTTAAAEQAGSDSAIADTAAIEPANEAEAERVPLAA
jgi:phage shock protein PspC (stress-responsive transcriptional regulator)